jgi:hypothetical protein
MKIIKTIATARRFENGLIKIELDEEYVDNHREDKELFQELTELTEIFNTPKAINGHELLPDYISLDLTKSGFARCTSYPAIRKEVE